jgi:hypothetical protein
MRYRVIEAPNTAGLTLLVNQAAADGWRPQGGVCVAAGEGGPHFYQAVVKVGPPDPVAVAVAEVAADLVGLPPAPPDAN